MDFLPIGGGITGGYHDGYIDTNSKSGTLKMGLNKSICFIEGHELDDDIGGQFVFCRRCVAWVSTGRGGC